MRHVELPKPEADTNRAHRPAKPDRVHWSMVGDDPYARICLHYRAWLYGERALEVQEESLAILTSTVPSDSSGCGHDAMAGNHDRYGVDVQRISRGARCPRGPRGGRHFPVGGHVTERNTRRGLQHPNGEAMN